jgi:hypothetical protein
MATFQEQLAADVAAIKAEEQNIHKHDPNSTPKEKAYLVHAWATAQGWNNERVLAATRAWHQGHLRNLHPVRQRG